MPDTQTTPSLQDLIAVRLSRRGVIAGLAALPLLSLESQNAAAAPVNGPSFAAVPATTSDTVTVPAGYRARPLIAWGDPLFDNCANKLDLNALTRAEQELRFGQNNDMLAIFPAVWSYPKAKDQSRFLLCANHEYVEPALTFPGVAKPADFTAAHIEAMLAALGVSIVTVERKKNGAFQAARDKKPGAGKNRRITPFTPVAFSGPAAKHPWIEKAAALVNSAEPGAPAGLAACGTQANCAGGETPWGTFLTCEENFDAPFFNSDPQADALAAARKGALAIDSLSFGYPAFDMRARPGAPKQFDLARNPTGPALYGWVVEIDPYDPAWVPKKRTALGRFKHEAASTALTRDGRIALYSGDDQIGEFVYKFVTHGRFDPKNRTANRDLLDEGQLYVARFDAEGTGRWIALSLKAANAAAAARDYLPFANEADLLVRAREAARLLGATPMDRPEDVEPVRNEAYVGLGPVLVVCTNNKEQGFESPGNPRRKAGGEEAQANMTGHILRLDEDGGDCAALSFKWDVFALAGDPNAKQPIAARRDGQPAHVGVEGSFTGDRFACPDNLLLDSANNVFIATDGSDAVFGDCNDSVLVASTTKSGARHVRRFLVGPVGCEICGPLLSPDEKTFFCAIQHPGESNRAGVPFNQARWQGAAAPSSYPDGGWPRSTVAYVTKDDGGLIGS